MMNDIEKIKKVAKLSTELKKHGFADDTVEAIQRSEKVYEANVPNETKKETKVVETERSNADPRFQKNIVKRLETLERTVQKLTEKMNEIIAEINKLGETAEVPQKQDVKPEPKEEVQQVIEKEEPPQKVGKYSPNDVAIDKVFYYGKK